MSPLDETGRNFGEDMIYRSCGQRKFAPSQKWMRISNSAVTRLGSPAPARTGVMPSSMGWLCVDRSSCKACQSVSADGEVWAADNLRRRPRSDEPRDVFFTGNFARYESRDPSHTHDPVRNSNMEAAPASISDVPNMVALFARTHEWFHGAGLSHIKSNMILGYSVTATRIGESFSADKLSLHSKNFTLRTVTGNVQFPAAA